LEVGDRTKHWTAGVFASRLPLTWKNISLMGSINYLMLRLLRHEFSSAATYFNTAFHRNSPTFALIKHILWRNSCFFPRRACALRKYVINQRLTPTKSVLQACQCQIETLNATKFRNKWPKI
jgi:hypothetical protein